MLIERVHILVKACQRERRAAEQIANQLDHPDKLDGLGEGLGLLHRDLFHHNSHFLKLRAADRLLCRLSLHSRSLGIAENIVRDRLHDDLAARVEILVLLRFCILQIAVDALQNATDARHDKALIIEICVVRGVPAVFAQQLHGLRAIVVHEVLFDAGADLPVFKFHARIAVMLLHLRDELLHDLEIDVRVVMVARHQRAEAELGEVRLLLKGEAALFVRKQHLPFARVVIVIEAAAICKVRVEHLLRFLLQLLIGQLVARLIDWPHARDRPDQLLSIVDWLFNVVEMVRKSLCTADILRFTLRLCERRGHVDIQAGLTQSLVVERLRFILHALNARRHKGHWYILDVDKFFQLFRQKMFTHGCSPF